MDDLGGPEAEFRAYLGQGKFMLQRSKGTGKHTFYPRVAIPGTGETDLEWVEASGRGTVYASTVNRGRDRSYNIVLVELDEGPRLLSTVEGEVAVAIGTRVQALIKQIEGEPEVIFKIEAGNRADAL